MKNDLIARYSGNVPRYTSYPTAPHFHEGVDSDTYAGWLGALRAGDTLSLYLHIPYCDRLCWFCACHTKQTLKYAPVSTYLSALKREIETVGARVDRNCAVTAIHFGGGSPTLLAPEDMTDLMQAVRAAFNISPSAEISVEMDPNDLDAARYDALAAIGMTRASLGVQDFAPEVQKAINRIQTFEQTKEVVDQVRARGVHSVNCDIVYGLPHQTMETFEATVADIVSLDPDRIAFFGYAHVPWMKKHQTMIDETLLAGPEMRFELMSRAAEMLASAGYQPIGLDHFAKPDDSLAVAAREGRLARNFQGYTDDVATALIGLGASSIGRMPQGYVQNIPATGVYETEAEKGKLAVVRGIAFSDDYRMRSWVIERLMCDFTLSFDQLAQEFGGASAAIVAEAQDLAASDRNVVLRDNRLCVAPEARPFIRSIAAHFDSYLGNGRGRHSIAV
jgi:oxygen-independent coproporphyrinogen-3 oxidase